MKMKTGGKTTPIVLAGAKEVDACFKKNPDVCNYFLGVILGHPEALVSDMSSLSDFWESTERDAPRVFARVERELGVPAPTGYRWLLVEMLRYLLRNKATVPLNFQGLSAFQMYDLIERIHNT
jgi:hypothetical protein